MLDLQVVEVRALTEQGGQSRPGSYIRGGRLWQPGWQEAVVDAALLELISSDPWLQVKTLDPRVQAAKKAEFAKVARAKANAAKVEAEALGKAADDLEAEAELALESVKGQSAPQAAPAPTPFQDALLAAMPDAARPETLKPKGKK